jgi:hypothetical protein
LAMAAAIAVRTDDMHSVFAVIAYDQIGAKQADHCKGPPFPYPPRPTCCERVLRTFRSDVEVTIARCRDQGRRATASEPTASAAHSMKVISLGRMRFGYQSKFGKASSSQFHAISDKIRIIAHHSAVRWAIIGLSLTQPVRISLATCQSGGSA